jgi:hypothetical protein
MLELHLMLLLLQCVVDGIVLHSVSQGVPCRSALGGDRSLKSNSVMRLATATVETSSDYC